MPRGEKRLFSADEFRQFAEEAVAAARAASSDDERKHFLDMARMWATAAAKMDGSMVVPPAPDALEH
jgi:hypothetical protein